MDLPSLWFGIWGLLWSLYFVTDGFDLGVGILYPLLGKTDQDRESLVASIGPFWDGNEVWLVTAGAVTFAAFPVAYAVMFSAFYTAFFLLLVALILRGAGLEFHGQLPDRTWRAVWGTAFFLGSLAAPVLIGVAFGNLFMGIPLTADGYRGHFTALLHPYALLTGVTFAILFTGHGVLWIAVRVGGELQERAAGAAMGIWVGLALVMLLFLVNTAFATGLAANYLGHPVLFMVPMMSIASLVLMGVFIIQRRYGRAFAASCCLIVSLNATALIGMYPFLIPSRIDPSFSLTVFNAASSPYTLGIMTVVAALFLPLIAAYQLWVYRVFRGGVTGGDSHTGGYGENK
ncbi:MAG: cytochrome d ubiquinol oxidase subunit II [Syntrophales bacterium]|nr:cytochrome d ubiquinol oxidase subunit II [Syntrophales bacterium]